MKKINFLLLFVLTAGVLSNFLFSGCGGGGGGNVTGVEPQITATSTFSAATVTPVASVTARATMTSTAVASVTAVSTATSKPTTTAAPTSTISPSVTGKITGMFNGTAVSGATVALGSASATTDAQGNFAVSGTSGRMVVSMGGYYDYSFPITSSPLDVLLVGTDMNNNSYSSYFIGGVSKRWLVIPKFRINENITAAQAAVIKNIILNELPGLTGGFMKVTETEILSTTTTEPELGEVVISMDNAATNSFAELSYSGNEIVACKIVYRDEDLDLDKYSLRTLKHELGHMVGFNHPFAVLGWDSPDLPISVMNYIEEHDKSAFEYSPFDIQAGIRKYHRAAGNTLPDTDPDSVSAKKETKIEKQIFK